jgi:sugar phosphate isomerase/epimerase
MIKLAFSTVACPDWTLDEVAGNAARYGYAGVELRTFGERSTRLACDPALTANEKTLAMFRAVGVEIVSLGASTSFHQPVTPPVIGEVISDTEGSVREAKRAVDRALALECPFVRVFGFAVPDREKRRNAVGRIARRLTMVADHAAKTGVRIVVQNGGSFPTAASLRELLDAIANPLVGACYSLEVGVKEGDDVASVIGTLGDRLWMVRIKDLDAEGLPRPLGAGVLPCKHMVQALVAAGFDGPLVYEWDRLWFPTLAKAADVLPAAALQVFQWLEESNGRRPTASSQTGAHPAPVGGAR